MFALNTDPNPRCQWSLLVPAKDIQVQRDHSPPPTPSPSLTDPETRLKGGDKRVLIGTLAKRSPNQRILWKHNLVKWSVTIPLAWSLGLQCRRMLGEHSTIPKFLILSHIWKKCPSLTTQWENQPTKRIWQSEWRQYTVVHSHDFQI